MARAALAAGVVIGGRRDISRADHYFTISARRSPTAVRLAGSIDRISSGQWGDCRIFSDTVVVHSLAMLLA